jgi:hypothetical protein
MRFAATARILVCDRAAGTPGVSGGATELRIHASGLLELLKPGAGMIIYVHMKHTAGSARENAANNAALAPYYGQVAPYHQSVPAGEIKHVYVTESTFIRQVIARVTSAAGHARSIWRLMVNCHGEPGLISLGEGITVWNASVFSDLRPFMTPNGSGITIGCCYAAAGGIGQGGHGPRGYLRRESHDENGLTLLTEIARYSGVKVEGALDEQITWDLNGPVLTVFPDGTYAIRSGRTEDSIRPGMSQTEDALTIPD